MIDQQLECRSMGSNLTSVHSEEELKFLWDVMFVGGGWHPWTGLKRTSRIDPWYWIDQTEVDYLYW